MSIALRPIPQRAGLVRPLLSWLAAVRSVVLGQWPSRDPALAAIFGDRPLSSGVSVNESTALNYSAVWAAISVISQDIASLPLVLYRRLANGGKERATEHGVYRLLHDEPNPEMTSIVFRETLQAHVLSWGGAYAEIQRDRGGRPVALWPIAPNRVHVYRTEDRKRLAYRIHNDQADPTILFAEDVLHIPGLSFDGVIGYSVIKKARESIGLGMATEQFGARFFGSGSRPGGVLQHKGKLGEEAVNNLRRSWRQMHEGVDHSHAIAILEEGMEWKQLGIPPDDAQFLETRKFQIAEVARWFKLPPHKLADLERATFTNIEHQSLEYVTHTLRSWLVRWEQELNRKLLSPLERKTLFAEHLVEGLLRGDTQSRYQAYAQGRQWGWLSVDEIREKENMNPLPDGQGKVYLAPTNMLPADKLGEEPPAPPRTPTPSMPMREEDEPEDRAALIAAHRSAFAEAVGRMVRKEVRAVGRAAGKPDVFLPWLEDFYPRYTDLFADAIRPVVAAHIALVGRGDAGELADRIACAHVARSRGELMKAFDDAHPITAIGAVIARWGKERPAELADDILREELTHAIQ